MLLSFVSPIVQSKVPKNFKASLSAIALKVLEGWLTWGGGLDHEK